MRYVIPVLFGLLLIPSVSFAATLNTQQVGAIIEVLQAFGVDSSTIQMVQSDLAPIATTTIQQSVPATFDPIKTVTPTFGPITVTQTPTQEATTTVTVTTMTDPQNLGAVSSWKLDVVAKKNGSDNRNIVTGSPTILAGTDSLRFEVSVNNPQGTQVKEPVTVTTNDPDLPSSFTINATTDEAAASGGTIGDSNFFCVAKPALGSTVLNGCSNPFAESKGTFSFTFTAQDASVTVPVTVQ